MQPESGAESSASRVAHRSTPKVIWCGFVWGGRTKRAANGLEGGWRDPLGAQSNKSFYAEMASRDALPLQFLVRTHGDGLIRANENMRMKVKGWSFSLKNQAVISHLEINTLLPINVFSSGIIFLRF